MAEIIATRVQAKSLSKNALKVIQAGITHAAIYRDVKSHCIPLDEFCTIAGTGLLSAEAMALIFREGQKVIAYQETFDTETPSRRSLRYESSAIFGEVSTSSSFVTFEVYPFILRDEVLRALSILGTSTNGKEQQR